ncbi:MAG: carbonic anhydrase [Candidatus Woesearchaeota archaeon]
MTDSKNKIEGFEMMEAKDVLKQIFEGNARHAEKTPDEHYEGLLTGQSPKLTLVYCSDSRVQSNVFDMNTTNYIFGIENIGNQVATAEGSVDYGVLHLKTPVLMVMGHTHCGAVHAALGDYSSEPDSIRKELDSLKEKLTGGFEDEDITLRETKYAQQNVDEQVAYAVKKYRKQVDEGGLTVIGAMFDFHNMYSDKKGDMFVVNINGDSDTGKMKGSGAMSGLDNALRGAKVKRV